jgi:hypothetical protein
MKLLAMLAAISLYGCASISPTVENVEGFRIYDIKAEYSSALTGKLSSNLKAAMQDNAGDVQFNNTLPPANLPEKPGRFELGTPFKNATGLLAVAGTGIKIPQCPGAVIEATSHKAFAGAEKTTFFVCLMPYQKGYHLNVYFKYFKSSGGLSSEALGRALAQSVVGDSSQFIPRTIGALENAVRSGGVEPTLLESYP